MVINIFVNDFSRKYEFIFIHVIFSQESSLKFNHEKNENLDSKAGPFVIR